MAGNHKNANINWPTENPDGNNTYEQARLAVLMDIRHELQRLNNVFHCHNFLEVPVMLRKIMANTAKPKRRKKAK